VLLWFYLLLPLVEYLREKSYLKGVSLPTLESLSQPGEELEICPVQPSPVMVLLFLLTRQVTVKHLFEEFQR